MYEVKRVEHRRWGAFSAITVRTSLHNPLDPSAEAVDL
jgi:hypothetical protein